MEICPERDKLDGHDHADDHVGHPHVGQTHIRTTSTMWVRHTHLYPIHTEQSRGCVTITPGRPAAPRQLCRARPAAARARESDHLNVREDAFREFSCVLGSRERREGRACVLFNFSTFQLSHRCISGVLNVELEVLDLPLHLRFARVSCPRLRF